MQEHSNREVAPSSDGLSISYEVHGKGGATIVFVHGWSCDRSYWNGQLEPFSRDYRVVTIDLAGHGDSGLGREAWTIAAFGADVAAVADHLGLDRMVLVGHSMGGDVIVEAARLLRGRVAGLVWVDVYKQLRTFRTPEEVQNMMAPFRASFVETTRAFVRQMFPPGSDESLVGRVVADMSAALPDVALGAMESALTFGPEIAVALPELNLPMVAINSDEPPTHVESLERFGIDVVPMSGVGHFPMMENPEGFNPLLRKAVKQLLARGARRRPSAVT